MAAEAELLNALVALLRQQPGRETATFDAVLALTVTCSAQLPIRTYMNASAWNVRGANGTGSSHHCNHSRLCFCEEPQRSSHSKPPKCAVIWGAPGNFGATGGFLLNDLLPILLIIFMAMFLLRDRGSRGGSPMITPGGGGCCPDGPAAAWLANLRSQQHKTLNPKLPHQAALPGRGQNKARSALRNGLSIADNVTAWLVDSCFHGRSSGRTLLDNRSKL